jgi:large subunit ribosomal protein L30
MPAKKQIKITLVRSLIGHPRDQRDTARALRLTRRGRTVVHTDNPQIRGMVHKIKHLVKVENA